MDVGVRELKAKLSEYLDRAASGEVIRVTDRGRPKAVLGPVPGQDRIDQGIREGWITPGNGEPPRRITNPVKANRSVAEIIAADRESDWR
jgi:prevent-host-death family protein